jgi:glutamyl aminopeptidase
MPVQNITEIPGTDYVITKFYDSLPMQSYLLAFTISNFDYIQNNDVDIPQRIYAKPESIRNGEGDFIINEVGAILKMCDELFGVPHALPKLDHVAVPYHVYSAMENYGLYTYAEWNLLLDPREAPQYTMLEIIAHETAVSST